MKEYTNKIDTAGDGQWSTKQKTVNCIGYDIVLGGWVKDGILRVFFDESWNIQTDGLICSDSAFLRGIRDSFGDQDIQYSDHSMQGLDFVSFDVGASFFAAHGE